MDVLPRRRRLLTACLACVDGCLGDLLADTPDHLRRTPAFAAVCAAVQPLAAATVRHAAADPAALRCLRRLLAALLPLAAAPEEEAEGGDEGSESDGGEEEGGHEAAGEEMELSGSEEEGEEGEEEEKGEEEEEEEEGEEGEEEEEDGTEADEEAHELRGAQHATGAGEAEGEVEDEGWDEGEELLAEVAGADDVEEQEEEDAGEAEVVEVEVVAPAAAETEAAAPLQLSYGIVPNPGAAAAAGAMLEALVTSRHLLATFSNAAAAGGGASINASGSEAAALPAALERLPLPLVSLLPLGELQDTAAAAATASPPTSPDAAAAVREAVRLETATLLETLLDMRLSYDWYDEYGMRHPQAAHSGEGMEQEDAADEAAAAAAAGPFGRSGSGERRVLGALAVLLQCGYGGGLAGGDRAVLRVLLRLDELAALAEAAEADVAAAAAAGGGDVDMDNMDATAQGGYVAAYVQSSAAARRLAGPLARSGFLWGAAASYYHQRLQQAAGGAGAGDAGPGGAGPGDAAARELQARALAEAAAPEPRALGMACVRFPVGRTLAADEDDPWSLASAPPASSTWSAPGAVDGSGEAGSALAAAGADPAWLLPFGVCCLRAGTGTVQDLAGWGVLALALRCLAAADLGLRALAYELLAAAAAQLDGLTAAAAAAAGTGKGAGSAAAGAGAGVAVVVTPAARAVTDFRQRPQLQVGTAQGAHLVGFASCDMPTQLFGSVAELSEIMGIAVAVMLTALVLIVPPHASLQALLAHVRNCVTAPLQQLPHTSALFAAEAATVMQQPQVGPGGGRVGGGNGACRPHLRTARAQ